MKYKLNKKIVLEFQKDSIWELNEYNEIVSVFSKKYPPGKVDSTYIYTDTASQIIRDFIRKGHVIKLENEQKKEINRLLHVDGVKVRALDVLDKAPRETLQNVVSYILNN